MCDLNVNPLKSETIDNFAPGSTTADASANLALAGTGWSVGYCDVTKQRTAVGTNCSPFDCLSDIAKAYSCDITFDTTHKLVNIHQQQGTDRGAYLAEDLNLKTLQVQGNSRDYCTRLYPIGKDGMTIASVNGGVPYVSNYQYSTEVIVKRWTDNRYTSAADMMADAQDRLAYLSKPTRAYSANIVDLARVSDQWGLLDFQIGDTITLQSYSAGVREQQRIVKIDRYLDKEEAQKTTCEISNKIASLDDIVLRVSDAADALNAATDSTGTIMGSSVQVTNPDGSYSTLTAAMATVGELIATKATITDLQAATARITTLEATSVTTTYLATNYLTADSIRTTYATIDNVQATYATIDNLNTQKGRIDTLESTTVTTTYLTAHYTTTTDLQAAYATITSLTAATGRITTLESDSGTIINLLSNNAGIGSLTTSTATANYAALLHGTLGDAQIGSLSVAKLLAGVISTTKFTLQSDSGRLSLADNTMQVSDANRVRVQLGKDGNGDYNIYVWDVSGNLMFDAAGLHSYGIKSGIIRDSMVASDAAINATKIDKESMVSQINGATTLLNSSRVKYDSTGQTLTVAFDALKTTVTSQGSTLSSQGTAISTVQGQISSKIWTTDITSAMSGLAGSGTNLLLASNFDDLSKWNAATEWKLSADKYNGNNIMVGDYSATAYSGSVYSSIYQLFAYPGKIALNTPYTISFYIKCDTIGNTGSNFRWYFTNLTGTSTDNNWSPISEVTDWIKVSRTIIFTAQNTGHTPQFIFRVWSGSRVYITQPKLEQGTVATGWSPAPEDTATAISANSSAITQLNNQIALKVDTSTYNSDVGNLQTRMSSAEEKITSDAIVSTVTTSSSWSSLSNTASTASTTASSAASAAAAAQSTANARARSFTSQPTPPYSLGDIWTSTTQETRVCTTARSSGSYTASDWTAASSLTESRMQTAESKITPSAITLTVKQNLGGADIASIINATATDVTINTSHFKVAATSIDIDGLVTQLNTKVLYAQKITSSGSSVYGIIGTFSGSSAGLSTDLGAIKITDGSNSSYFGATAMSFGVPIYYIIGSAEMIGELIVDAYESGTPNAGTIFNIDSGQFFVQAQAGKDTNGTLHTGALGLYHDSTSHTVQLSISADNFSIDTSGNVTASGVVTAPSIALTTNGTGNNIKLGDDAYLGDCNVANTICVAGNESGAAGWIRFGLYDTAPFVGNGAQDGALNIQTTGMWVHGTGGSGWAAVNASAFNNESSVDYKKNISKVTDSWLDKVMSADIVKYWYTDDDETKDAPCYGLAIGDGYNVPPEIISRDGNGINQYSMIAMLWKAVQELSAKVSALEAT